MTCLTLLYVLAFVQAPALPNRITILYDAFGPPSKLIKDWGYAAQIEYNGRRVLFDTGNDAKTFAHNARTLGIDLRKLDAAVISHRHGDHTSGLSHLLRQNPKVRIFAPLDPGMFQFDLPPRFLESHAGLPDDMRYFGGRKPSQFETGNPWSGARFETVAQQTEILPGFIVFSTRSEKAGTMEMNELALAIRTPQGLAVVVGCSHPGVDKVLERARTIEPNIYLVAGGLHLVMTPKADVERVAALLRDGLKVEYVAPGHCTSELGFAVFMEAFGSRFRKAGLGTHLQLP